MKQTLNVAVSTIKTVTKIIDVDLPEVSTYYQKKYETGFAAVLFAIVLRGPKASPGNYYLLKVTSNRQEFDDFQVAGDVKSEYFIESKNNPLRKEAFNLITNDQLLDYDVIDEKTFYATREKLLNLFVEWIQ